MRNVLVANVCKPVIHKFKVLGGGKLEYCKSMGQPQKGEPKFEISEGGKQHGGHDFWLKFSGWEEGILEGTMPP